MALVVLNVESAYLHNNTEISIILPDKPRTVEPVDFYQKSKKFKVLWLLHGTFGDHTDWIRHTNIELYACERDLMVVMPSALNSDYANWDGFAMGYSMFDFLPKELMPLVYAWFPASDRREDNFIAGLSMGGRGTMTYVASYPEKFAAAAVLSAPVRDMPRSSFATDPAMARRWQNMTANEGGLEGYQRSYQNVWDRLPDLVRKGVLPRLYFACGKQDGGYGDYQTFKQYAAQIGLQAEWEAIDTFGHEWRFWDLTIQHALDFFGLPKVA